MDFMQGQIVKAKAGRDKGNYFVVVKVEEKYVYICDGKSRPVDRPKKKKLIHLEPTKTIVGEKMDTNRNVKKILREFKGS